MHPTMGKKVLMGLFAMALMSGAVQAQTNPYDPYGPTTGAGMNPGYAGVPTGFPASGGGWVGAPQTPTGMPVSGGAAAAYLASLPSPSQPPVGVEPTAPTPTAAAQGFDRANPRLEAWQAAGVAARNTPRQKGQQVSQPAPLNPVGEDPTLKGWLAGWSRALGSVGVSVNKVAFEAARLDADSFARWASRQVWASGLRVTAVDGDSAWHVDVDSGKSP